MRTANAMKMMLLPVAMVMAAGLALAPMHAQAAGCAKGPWSVAWLDMSRGIMVCPAPGQAA
jgi:hypothetical protein